MCDCAQTGVMGGDLWCAVGLYLVHEGLNLSFHVLEQRAELLEVVHLARLQLALLELTNHEEGLAHVLVPAVVAKWPYQDRAVSLLGSRGPGRG